MREVLLRLPTTGYLTEEDCDGSVSRMVECDDGSGGRTRISLKDVAISRWLGGARVPYDKTERISLQRDFSSLHVYTAARRI